jgi:hypothetical protein
MLGSIAGNGKPMCKELRIINCLREQYDSDLGERKIN